MGRRVPELTAEMVPNLRRFPKQFWCFRRDLATAGVSRDTHRGHRGRAKDASETRSDDRDPAKERVPTRAELAH